MEKNKKKLYFITVNTKVRTREISDIFNTFGEIYLVFTSKE